MFKIFIRHWWFLAARAILALALGLLAFSLRGLVTEPLLIGPIYLTVLQASFALLALVAGIITLAAAVAGFAEEKWWILVLDGCAGVAAGILILAIPSLSFANLVRLISLWGMVLGILECIGAAHVRRHLKDEWILGVSGGGTLFLSCIVIVGLPKTDPGLVIWLSWFAFFSALVMAMIAFRMRVSWRHVRAEIRK